MTKKHYKAIAKVLREAKEDLQGGMPAELVLDDIDAGLAEYFVSDNPHFDFARFIDACEAGE